MDRKTLGMSQSDITIKKVDIYSPSCHFKTDFLLWNTKEDIWKKNWKLTSFGSHRFPLYGSKKQIFQNILFCVQQNRFEMTREQVVDDNFWVDSLFNHNQTKRWWGVVEMDSDCTLWCMTRAVQSVVPWANRSQSNTASFSQCLTAFGAFQSLKKRHNPNR